MDDILDKIAKLMAKAKGTDNEHEAAIFAAKAAELLAQHNLTEAQLESRGKERESGPIGAHAYAGRVPDRWRELILMGCAKLYFCKVTVNKQAGKSVYAMYGREANAKVASLMAEYLMATVKRMAREYSPAKVEQGDFRRGAGARLYERLVELYNVQNAKPEYVSSGTALALYDGEFQAIDEYMSRALGKLKFTKAKPMKMGIGAMVGRARADSIGLNTQVTAETRASRMVGSK